MGNTSFRQARNSLSPIVAYRKPISQFAQQIDFKATSLWFDRNHGCGMYLYKNREVIGSDEKFHGTTFSTKSQHARKQTCYLEP